ncbi:TetR/AcrR family transcriptional regulator [Salibacterium aidingense]|uniref:TetR/AcrR family transcriptional regulator n=1 Tax=Salibacterium aidingense TaxID=384933 RepID=UPI003BCFA5BC
MKEGDRRVKRTRRLLKNALLELIHKKGFNAITVRDLTEKADVNRATFYQHYHDKFDLLDQAIDDMLLSLVTYVVPKNVEEITDIEKASPVFVRLFEFIYDNTFFFQVMMGKNGIPSFQRRMVSMIQQFMNEKLEQFHPQPEKMDIPREILIHYISFAHLGLISYWLESDMQYSPGYMARQLSSLTVKGPLAAGGLLYNNCLGNS